MKKPLGSKRIICLTGMDGTGKTTQAREVIRRCRDLGLNAGYVWARWEPFFLRPVVERYFRKQQVQDREGDGFEKAVHAKGKVLQHAAVRSAWRALSLLDYWLTKRPRILRAQLKWDVLVCDRYAYDFAIDQALNLGLSPAEMVRDLEGRIFRCFPKPDRTLVLFLPAEEGSKRKQDGTGVGYLKARDAYYRALLDCNGVTGVDASGLVEKVHEVVWEHLRPVVMTEGRQ